MDNSSAALPGASTSSIATGIGAAGTPGTGEAAAAIGGDGAFALESPVAAQPTASAAGGTAAAPPTTGRGATMDMTPSSPSPAGALHASELLSLIYEANYGLQSGHFAVTTQAKGGVPSSTDVMFDLGGAGTPVSLYTRAGASAERMERLTIGSRSCRREGNGRWLRVAGAGSIDDTVQSLLPHFRSASDVRVTQDGNTATLLWDDSSRDLRVVLQINTTTGLPVRLESSDLQGRAAMVVEYLVWNVRLDTRQAMPRWAIAARPSMPTS